jgi:peptidoglycan hydrolase CwlO-like protein
MQAELEIAKMLIAASSGPASGVIVSLIMLGSFLYFLIKHLLPQQEKQFQTLMNDADKNRKAFETAVEKMSTRIEVIEDDIDDLKDDLKNVLSKLDKNN